MSFEEDVMVLMPHLRAFARSLAAGNAALADDLVQDTILRALEAQDQYREGTNLKAWLFTILRNQHLSLLRRKRTRNEVCDEDIDRLGSVPAFQESMVEITAFRRAFGQLSHNHRAVLILVGVEGLQYEEVGRIMGCEVGTVKSRVNRARNALKRILGDDEPASTKGGATTRPASFRSGELMAA